MAAHVSHVNVEWNKFHVEYTCNTGRIISMWISLHVAFHIVGTLLSCVMVNKKKLMPWCPKAAHGYSPLFAPFVEWLSIIGAISK
jgi:hypothetical protein